MNYSKTLRITLLSVIAISLICCKPSTKSGDEADNNQPQGQAPSVTDLLNQMDTDNDGKLSKSETKGPIYNDFSKIDKNNDGLLTKEELENAPRPERRGRGGREESFSNNIQKDFDVTINVDASLFIKENLLKEITQEERTLSNGTKALCYIITTASQPSEHKM